MKDLVTCLWGLAALGVRPGPAWLARYEAASMRQVAAFTVAEVATTLHSLARLRLLPSASWLLLLARQLEVGGVAFVGARCCGGLCWGWSACPRW